jgi:hypothetical protein
MTANLTAWTLIAIGIAMFFIGGGVFAAAERPAEVVEQVGGISFFTWWIPVLLGGFMLFIRRYRRDDPNSD